MTMDAGINPVVPERFYPAVQQAQGQQGGEGASKQFSAFFLKNMLKKVFKEAFSPGVPGGDGSGTALFSEMAVDRVLDQLSETDAFGIGRMVDEGLDRRQLVRMADEIAKGM